MTTFEPELGQALFSNSGTERQVLPVYMERGLEALAEAIEKKRYGAKADGWCALTTNSGDPEYVCDVFAMRAYCWCDGAPGHEEGCPPNFEHRGSGLVVRWYKWLGRGTSVNRVPSRKEWRRILAECQNAVEATDPGGQNA